MNFIILKKMSGQPVEKSQNSKHGRGRKKEITKKFCCVCEQEIKHFGNILYDIFGEICKDIYSIIGEYSQLNNSGVIIHKTRREIHGLCFPCHNNIIKFVNETGESNHICPKKKCDKICTFSQ